jgi:hypothetical protein
MRCPFDHNGQGPRCCIESAVSAHEGPHRFKCAGEACPGLIWPASVMPHPVTCTADTVAADHEMTGCRTSCPACDGNGCDRCIPGEFDPDPDDFKEI